MQGMRRTEAYLAAGYETSRKYAGKRGSELMGRPEIAARIAELQEECGEDGIYRAKVDRAWVLGGLKDNISRASESGNASAVNRGYELVGKELGMFAERLILDNLDAELEKLTGADLRKFVRAAAGEVGLRVVDMNDDEQRAWIRQRAPRLGLRIAGDGENPEGPEPSEDRRLHAVS